MDNNIFTPDWEKIQNERLMKRHPHRRKGYICSPLSAKTDEGIVHNMRAARAYMLYASEKMDIPAAAPHAYLPLLLCDRTPAERKLALDFGQELLKSSEVVLVCGKRISEGMKLEITKAALMNMEIITFDKSMYRAANTLALNSVGEKNLVRLNLKNPFMALADPIAFIEGGETV